MQTHLPKSSSFFVAEQGKEIVGCCALQIYSRRLAEVRSLAVHADCRGMGVATGLITSCLERARQRKVYEVLAISGVQKLFAKFGFKTFQQEKYALLIVL